MTTISFIGAGNIGANVARAAANAGYDVILSNNRGPDSLAGLAADIGSRASTASTEDAANQGDVVVIAVPYTAFESLPTEALAGKVVLATTNYIPEYTGHIAALDDTTVTEVGMLQRRLPHSKVVKAFSHLNAAEVPTTGTPPGTPNRRALAIAGEEGSRRHLRHRRIRHRRRRRHQRELDVRLRATRVYHAPKRRGTEGEYREGNQNDTLTVSQSFFPGITFVRTARTTQAPTNRPVAPRTRTREDRKSVWR
jgi:8-hydroxy-5-deazaflavin:NADPH oxidoreductase